MRCPFCGKSQHVYMDVNFRKALAEPGDANICSICYEISVVGEGRELRDMTEAEAKEIAGHKGILKAQAFYRYINKRKRQE